MKIVLDTSVIIAVIVNEPEKARLIELTKKRDNHCAAFHEMGNWKRFFRHAKTVAD
jgi:predicted nucleic acid-binding protein